MWEGIVRVSLLCGFDSDMALCVPVGVILARLLGMKGGDRHWHLDFILGRGAS